MPTSYTSLLGLALPVTGELSGTWGDTVNDYITQYLDASVAGTQTISGSQTAVTLSKTTATSLSQAGSGATGSSQYNIINCTGNPASMLTVTVPAASKTYVVVNATSTNQDVKIVGAGPTTGVTLVAGEKAVIAWNGSDFIKIATSTADGVTTLSFGTTGLTPSTATSGAVTVAGTLVAANGGTGQSSYTTGDLLYATGSTALSKLGIGTNGQILTSTGTAPQWSTLSGVAVTTFSAGTTGFTPSSATSGAVTLAGTLATTNGGTGLTSFTANGVVYASSSSALTTGSALSFDGTRLTVDFGSTGTNRGIFKTGPNASFANVTGISLNGDLSDAGLAGLFGGGQSNTYLQSTTGGDIVHRLGNTEGMRLTSTSLYTASGINVAIGTSSPYSGTRLTLQESASNPSGLAIRNRNSTQTWQISVDAAAVDDKILAFIDPGAGVVRMSLDSSGNLGLGVTPSAWDTYRVLEAGFAGSAFISNAGSSQVGIVRNARWASGGWKFTTATSATLQLQQNGEHQFWRSTATPVIGNDPVFSQAMTLDASGNLLVGTTTANAKVKLALTSPGTLGTVTNVGSFGSGGVVSLGGVANNTDGVYLGTGDTGGTGVASGIGFLREASGWNSALAFYTNNVTSGPNGVSAITERARITSGGNLSLGGSADRGTTVGTNAIQIFNGTAPAGTLTNGVSLYSSSGDLNFMNSAGNGFKVGYRNLPPVGTQTGSYTLATGDVGKYVQVGSGGSITIPDATFAEGDAVSIFNNTTGNITITCSITTAYIAGTDSDKATMTLATRGVATILFISGTVCVVTGNVT